MSDFEDNLKLIEEYNKWLTQGKLNDFTPERFLQEKIMEEAVDRLSKLEEYVNAIAPFTVIDSMGIEHIVIASAHLGTLKGIINGDF